MNRHQVVIMAITAFIIAAVIVLSLFYVLSHQTASVSKTTTTIAVSSTTTVTTVTTTTIRNTTAVLDLYSSNTIGINATRGGTVSTPGPDGVLITATIPDGTFALVNNSPMIYYNFTLATFRIQQDVGPPPSYINGTAAAYGFAFEVNGQITSNITLVNRTNSPVGVMTTANYPPTWGSWAFVGGTFNRTTGKYVGGTYKARDTWTYNSMTGVLTNTQFSKPVMWIWIVVPALNTSSTGNYGYG